MNLTVRIKGQTLEVFDTTSGGIRRTLTLPPGQYSNTVLSGDRVTVTITTPYGLDRIRTYNIKTGTLISDLQI